MRVVFKADGSYADNEQSARSKALDKELRENAASRYGGSSKDYTVIETSETTPWLFRLQDGKVIPDEVKIDAEAARVVAEETKATRHENLRTKVASHTASPQEICKYLIPGDLT